MLISYIKYVGDKLIGIMASIISLFFLLQTVKDIPQQYYAGNYQMVIIEIIIIIFLLSLFISGLTVFWGLKAKEGRIMLGRLLIGSCLLAITYGTILLCFVYFNIVPFGTLGNEKHEFISVIRLDGIAFIILSILSLFCRHILMKYIRKSAASDFSVAKYNLL
jgi:hypothetical protein